MFAVPTRLTTCTSGTKGMAVVKLWDAGAREPAHGIKR